MSEDKAQEILRKAESRIEALLEERKEFRTGAVVAETLIESVKKENADLRAKLQQVRLMARPHHVIPAKDIEDELADL